MTFSQDTKVHRSRRLDESETNIVPQLQEEPTLLLTEQVVGDAKEFIKIMVKTVIDFYSPVIRQQEILDMKEDIIETVTNIILSKDVYKIVFSFFRLEFDQLENDLSSRFTEFKDITPSECRINEYFRCDKGSPILKIYDDIMKKDWKSIFSEPMSINFDSPMYHSYREEERKDNPLNKTRSVANHEFRILVSGVDNEKDFVGTYDDEVKSESIHEGKKRTRSTEFLGYTPPKSELQKLPKMSQVMERLGKRPFHAAILRLREIEEKEGPMMKVRLLESVNDTIKQ